MLTILVRKVGVFVFEREKTRSAKVFKSSGRQFFLERAVKALPLFIYLTIKKKTSVDSVLSKKTSLKNYTTEKSMSLIPYKLALQPDH